MTTRVNNRMIDASVLHVRDFNVPKDGVTPASVALQVALDAAEGKTLEFDKDGVYFLDTNIYLGDVELITHGAIFKVLSDNSFVATGTASRRNEGVILTKSCENAGYGVPLVNITMDEFNLEFSRPVHDEGPKTALLFENVDSFSCVKYKATTENQDSAKNVFDMYAGVQNVWIGLMDLHVRNGNRAEAAWIRNNDITRPTRNITIERLVYDYEGLDECMAIFNFGLNPSDLPDVSDVTIKDSYIRTGGRGQGLSVLNNRPSSDSLLKNINFGSVRIIMNSSGDSAFGFKATECFPKVSKLSIQVNDLSAATGNIFLTRAINTNSQAYFTEIENLDILLLSEPTDPTARVVGANGLLRVGDIRIRTGAGARFWNMVDGAAEIKTGLLGGDYQNKAVRNSKRIYCDVRGAMEGVHEFKGRHTLDTQNFPNAIWFIHSDLTNSELPVDEKISYNADVFVQGNEDVSNIVSANFTQTRDVFLDIVQRIDARNNQTIGQDFNGNSVKLVSYDSVLWNGVASSRRNKSLDL